MRKPTSLPHRPHHHRRLALGRSHCAHSAVAVQSCMHPTRQKGSSSSQCEKMRFFLLDAHTLTGEEVCRRAYFTSERLPPSSPIILPVNTFLLPSINSFFLLKTSKLALRRCKNNLYCFSSVCSPGEAEPISPPPPPSRGVKPK